MFVPIYSLSKTTILAVTRSSIDEIWLELIIKFFKDGKFIVDMTFMSFSEQLWADLIPNLQIKDEIFHSSISGRFSSKD